MRVGYSLLALVSVLSLGCAEEELPKNLALVKTSAVASINEEGASFEGDAELIGKTQVSSAGFELTSSYEEYRIKATDNPTGPFSIRLTAGLIKGYRYYVRAYVVTRKGYIIYGNAVSFFSQGCSPPTILNFTPTSGSEGDLITINGDNFGPASGQNIVKLRTDGSWSASEIATIVESASKTQLKVRCVHSWITGNLLIQVQVGEHKAISSDYYTKLN